MKPIALVLAVVAIMLAACEPDRAAQPEPPSPPARTQTGDEEPPPARALIYAAVIRRLVLRDHTFGGGRSPFERVYVIDGAIEGAASPTGAGDLFGPAPERFPSAVVAAIEERLQDLPPVRFVSDGDRLVRTRSRSGVKDNGVIISLGPIERANRRVRVPNGLYCGGLCGQWLTYVLRPTETRWRVVGTTGPYIIS